MRERRYEAALVREANAIEKYTNFCVAEKSASQAQAAAAAYALDKATGVATTTTAVPSTTSGRKKIMKRKLPEPSDGWKDQSSKQHRVHHETMLYHKQVSGICWKIMDIVHDQASNSSGELTPYVLLARLVPFKEMEEKKGTYTVKELLEMGLNCVHEAAHALYIKHVYNETVAETFTCDPLVGAARTIPIEDRVDSAVKRVQKLSTAAKTAVGQSSRGGSTFGRRGGGRRGGYSNYNGGRQQ
jgi:hypothetical protein